MRSTENIKKLISKMRVSPPAQMDQQIHDAISHAANETHASPPAHTPPNIWSTIMKNKTSHIAAAALILIAVILGLILVGPTSVTWAHAVQPILNAQTIIFDITTSEDGSGPVIHDIIAENRIRRTISNMDDLIMIIDLDNTRMLTLSINNKQGQYFDIEGPLKDQSQNFLDFLRKTINNFQDNPNFTPEKLDPKQIDGRSAIGFFARNNNEEITIWADSKTTLPIQIKFKIGTLFFLITNFQIDPPVEKSLVSMDLPSGYTQTQTTIDMSQITEEKFIIALRSWVQLVLKDQFPDKLTSDDFMNQLPLVAEKINQQPITDQEIMDRSVALGQGFLFLQLLEGQNNTNYAGAGVKFGDAQTPIFWYQPQNSPNYRVIYGDLTVKEKPPQEIIK
ncbi:MAG: hypothetical protein GY869_07685 [Planctomycetes bacterium]|nr:hypothetical protein [Planctomycetota bacterium]